MQFNKGRCVRTVKGMSVAGEGINGKEEIGMVNGKQSRDKDETVLEAEANKKKREDSNE